MLSLEPHPTRSAPAAGIWYGCCNPPDGMARPLTHTLVVPDFSLVVLVGPPGVGKTEFALRHFQPEEVISLADCRDRAAPTSGISADVSVGKLLHRAANQRLGNRLLAVLDAPNLAPRQRHAHVRLARRQHAPPICIVLGTTAEARAMEQEGFARIHRLESPEQIDAVLIERQRLRCDRRQDAGPFDIIGDIHGCADELEALLAELGYVRSSRGGDPCGRMLPPPGRRAVFVGDLVDRGPRVAEVLRLVMNMVADGSALCVLGNHDVKLLRWLNGRKVTISHGIDASIERMSAASASFREAARRFLADLVDHYWLDEGRLCVAHAGLREEMIGRASGAVRAFALYGDTTGEKDEFGLPVRLDWAARYRGEVQIVYGHTPVVEPRWRNRTICIDTGCVFGGALTALRYPENELVSVPAREVYYQPIRPPAQH